MLLVIALQLSSMLTSETRPRNVNNSVAFYTEQIPSELEYRETSHQVNNAEHVPSTSRTNEFDQLADSNQVLAQSSLIQVQNNQNSAKITQPNTNKPPYPLYQIVFQPIAPKKTEKPEQSSTSSVAEEYLVDNNLLTYLQSTVPNMLLIQQPLNVPVSIALNTHVPSNYMNISDVNPIKSCSTEHIAEINSTVIRNNEFYQLPQNSFDKLLEAATEMRDCDELRLTGDNKYVSADKMVQSSEIISQANNQSPNEKPAAKRINILREKAFSHNIRPQPEQYHTGWLNNAAEQRLDHERPAGLPHVSSKKYDCDGSSTIDSVGRTSVIQKHVQQPLEKKSIHIPTPFCTESITEYCSGQSSYKLNSAETTSLPTKQFTFSDSQELESKEHGRVKRTKFSDSKSITTSVSDVNPGKQDCLASNSSIKTTTSSKAMDNVPFDLMPTKSKIIKRKKIVEPLYNYAVRDCSTPYVDRNCACSHLDISDEQLFCFINELWTQDFLKQLLDWNSPSSCDLTGGIIMNFKNFVVFLKSCEKPKSKETKTKKHSRGSSKLTNPTVDSLSKFEKALRDDSAQISSEQDSKKLACENEILLNDVSHDTSCLDDITDRNNANEMKSPAFLNQEDNNGHLSTIQIKDKNRDFFDNTLDKSEIFLFLTNYYHGNDSWIVKKYILLIY
ncbi:hypothetical protein THOM_2699 [Trachipleistophora hominis]|uniref:Uncharacterized protein n=1 Tax=Trachipleistophora hominis TaxID=72359 RepID=L7JTM1_TRAHO|nr:hypothetical protein THOM_2699 [Trachipleistophora hominis]